MKNGQSQRATMIGVGGMGGRIVATALTGCAENLDCFAADSDVHALCRVPREHRLRLGVALTGGLGTYGRAQVGRAVAEHSNAEFARVLLDRPVCLIATSLAGGLGSGATPLVAQGARSVGALAVGLVAVAPDAPPTGEALAALARSATATIVFPATTRSLADQATAVVQVARHFAAAFTTPTQGNSRAELLAALQGTCSAGIGEAAGRGRVSRAVDAALQVSPLVAMSEHAAKLVALVATAGDLGLFELEDVVVQLRERLGSAIEPVTVAHVDPSLCGQMRIVLLATDLPVDIVAAPELAVPPPKLRQRRAGQSTVPSTTRGVPHQFGPQLAPFPPERPTAAQRPLPLPIPIALAPPRDAPQLPELLLSPTQVVRLAPETLRRHRRQPEQRCVSLADRIGLAGRQLRQGMRRGRPVPSTESGGSVRLVQQAQRLSG